MVGVGELELRQLHSQWVLSNGEHKLRGRVQLISGGSELGGSSSHGRACMIGAMPAVHAAADSGAHAGAAQRGG